ncbi:uncharacterized protein NPIL_283101 [Nephila pilipes]|uniref:Uncharacterized protein n=1 Tax=Nephila pilipes TaxID=299642 RepID=A0A8X6PJJ6_NEPPI|nr:uncharacterized protein NPIL_283101 [Nephila pilipes]
MISPIHEGKESVELFREEDLLSFAENPSTSAERITVVLTAEIMCDNSCNGGERHFRQKALYVERLTRGIDPDTIPRDGSEYIHVSRLQETLTALYGTKLPKWEFVKDLKEKERKHPHIVRKNPQRYEKQKALYVEPLTRHVDLDTIPRDGSEYIHISRLHQDPAAKPANKDPKKELRKKLYAKQKNQNVKPPTRHIDPNTVPQDGSQYNHISNPREDLAAECTNKDSKGESKLHGEQLACEFSIEAKKLKKSKTTPQQNCPKKIENFYEKSDKEWCLFLFGSEICAEIYDTCTEGIEGHLPHSTSILYFSQDEIKVLIKYIYEWFVLIGMKREMSTWLYALFSSLEKPDEDDEFQEFLEEFLIKLKKYTRKYDCDDLHLYLVVNMLEQNFCAC